jgi:hypothetical protein
LRAACVRLAAVLPLALAAALAGPALQPDRPLAAAAAGPLAAPAPAPRPSAAPDPGTPVVLRAHPYDLDVAAASGPARLLSAHALSADHPGFGGLSAVAVSPDGARLFLLSDRAVLFTARLDRAQGRIAALADARAHPLRDRAGRLAPHLDSEGLALDGDAGFWVSFEDLPPKVWRYPAPGGRPASAPAAPAFARLQRNSGLEALAAGPDGTLFALPERSGALDRPFPVFRLLPGAAAWDAAEGAWPRLPPHLVTGAEIGPDGRLYVLERDVSLVGGFAVRVRRAPLSQWPVFAPETVLDLRRGGIDNMEGIALWRDPEGQLRMLLVSDDNLAFWQRSLLLEFALDG